MKIDPTALNAARETIARLNRRMCGTAVIAKAAITAYFEALPQAAVSEKMVEAGVEIARLHLEIDGDNDGPFIRFDSIDAAVRAILIGTPNPRPTGHIDIAHDGFSGEIIGHYLTREGKAGVVVQQDGTRVVHVYGEKWLGAAVPAEPNIGGLQADLLKCAEILASLEVPDGGRAFPTRSACAFARSVVARASRVSANPAVVINGSPIAEFVSGYRFTADDEGTVHVPNFSEQAMIEDAICSFISERDLLNAALGSEPAPNVMHDNSLADLSAVTIVLTAEETADYERTGRLRGATARWHAADTIVDANGNILKSKAKTYAEGIRAAAAFVQKRLDDYVSEHGIYDPETNATEFPGNGAETVGDWEEIIEGIAALATSQAKGSE